MRAGRARARPAPAGACARAAPSAPPARRSPQPHTDQRHGTRPFPQPPTAGTAAGPQPSLSRRGIRDAPGEAETARHRTDSTTPSALPPGHRGWTRCSGASCRCRPAPGLPLGSRNANGAASSPWKTSCPAWPRRAPTPRHHTRAASGGGRGQRPLPAPRCGAELRPGVSEARAECSYAACAH